ncbi:hypothetical protein [Streptomyces sp900116325]|uniref:hypothetical protein n=1 Tax=Streptomyces sp. 900116325 TaxID=3154295 RepID=UPI00332302AA
MDEQGTHFWYMVIYAVTSDGGGMRDFRGTFTPSPGSTRYDTFDLIKQKVHQTDPSTTGGTVMTFDIQPNVL